MVCLRVTGAPSTALLLRVINLIALNGLVFRSLQVDVMDEMSAIDVHFATASEPSQALVEKLRSLVEVIEVSVTASLGLGLQEQVELTAFQQLVDDTAP